MTKKTIYYYINHTCKTNYRSGIQNVVIYLARELIKNNNINIVFVKWSYLPYGSLVPCNSNEINHMFNYEITEKLVDTINYDNYNMIHTNIDFNTSIFFCAELVTDVCNNLSDYLKKYNIYNIFVLHDIIPLTDINSIEHQNNYNSFHNYIFKMILSANKIITVSEFTKNELIKYIRNYDIKNTDNISITDIYNIICKFNSNNIKSILLPYQYRNTNKNITRISDCEQSEFIILVAGSIEYRKQQVLLLNIINKFIQNNPLIDIKIIIYGSIFESVKEEFYNEINKSEGKFNYMGLISNEEIISLYEKTSFSCFISKYEGYGLPISESLWNGVPVLTANFGSMMEIAKVGGCYTVDTTNTDSIYNALDKLIKNPNILHKLREEINTLKLTTWKDYADLIYNEMI